jgi:hypothetical protein
MGEMLGAIITMIKIEEDLYIFYKRRRKDTRDKTTNTDGNLMPVATNKMVLYRNLKKMRQSYGIDNQDPYFFVREKLPPGTMIHLKTGY